MDETDLMLDEETGVVLPPPEADDPIQLDAEPSPREPDLFEESVLLSPSADALYDSETIIAAAFQYYRETGFPYPEQPVYISMQQLIWLHGSCHWVSSSSAKIMVLTAILHLIFTIAMATIFLAKI